MRTAIEGFMLQNIEEISLLWFLFYVASCGGMRALMDDAQGFRVVEGTQTMSYRLLEALQEKIRENKQKEPVYLPGQAVTGIKYSKESHANLVQVTTGSTAAAAGSPKKGMKLEARCVVLALSPKLLQRIHFDRPILREIAGRKWYGGTGIKWTLTFATPFWKDLGFSGMLVHSQGVPWVFDGLRFVCNIVSWVFDGVKTRFCLFFFTITFVSLCWRLHSYNQYQAKLSNTSEK